MIAVGDLGFGVPTIIDRYLTLPSLLLALPLLYIQLP